MMNFYKLYKGPLKSPPLIMVAPFYENAFFKKLSGPPLWTKINITGNWCCCERNLSTWAKHKMRQKYKMEKAKNKFVEILSLSEPVRVYNRRAPIRNLTVARLIKMLESEKENDCKVDELKKEKINSLWNLIFDLRSLMLKGKKNFIDRHEEELSDPKAVENYKSDIHSFKISLSQVMCNILEFLNRNIDKNTPVASMLEEIDKEASVMSKQLDVLLATLENKESRNVEPLPKSFRNSIDAVMGMVEHLLSSHVSDGDISILVPMEDIVYDVSTIYTFPGDDFEMIYKSFFEKEAKEKYKRDFEETPEDQAGGTISDAPSILTGPKKSKSQKNSLSDSNERSKCNSLMINLRCYLDICASLGMIKKAQLALHFFKFRIKDADDNLIKLVDLHNIILEALSFKNNFLDCKKWFDAMIKEGLVPNYQSFASILHCVGSSDEKVLPNYTQTVSEILSLMKSLDISLDSLFSHHVFIENQWLTVQKAIALVEPDYVPRSTSPPLYYNCNLLEELNCDDAVKASPALENVLTLDQIKELTDEQVSMEKSGFVSVKSIQKLADNVPSNLRHMLSQCEESWTITLLRVLKIAKQALRHRDNSSYFSRGLTLYPFLCAVPEKTIVDILLQEIRNIALGSETFSHSTTIMYENLGIRIASRFSMNCKEKSGIQIKIQKILHQFCEYYVDPEITKKYNPRQFIQTLFACNPDGPISSIQKIWPPGVCVSLGRFLYELMLNHCKINNHLFHQKKHEEFMSPIFFKIIRQSGYRHKEEMKPHPVLSKLYRLGAKDTLIFDASELPLVSPPLPWTSGKSGGYLFNNVELIRIPTHVIQHRVMMQNTPNQNLYPIFDSLNQLQCVPWKINSEILDVVIEIFNNKGNMSLDVPIPLSEIPVPSPMSDTMTQEERKAVLKARLEYRKERSEMYSLWCSALYKLSIANHFRDKYLWFPYNLDFRGRVYPCPPHFNHLGADLSRSLLVFAEGKPLGERGFEWLKTHVINITGKMKRESLLSRKKYAEEILSDIMDSADYPLTGKKWWMTSEEPWQTLAACKELTKAVRSRDPAQYVCHLPIHQDGSCNGLQHYAALGRDEVGGASVNLIPSERPQDVYNSVAVLVEEERAKDAAEGLEIAKLLEGCIQRKVIKQTVMTTVYGVTRYGARLQIAKQLKELPDFPKDKLWAASLYLVNKTFMGINKMFTASREIQDWFTECARLISGVGGQSVQWVTPLGLPIIQPYYRNSHIVQSKLEAIKLQFQVDTYSQPNTMKQKNAFPPNYIHSLDASHMMLTSLFCQKAGITYVSVHDCYWTHPSTVDIMNKICREQFVNLHSLPLLDMLSKDMSDRFSYDISDLGRSGSVQDIKKRKLNRILTEVPSKGNLDLQEVLKSVYFFS